MIIYECKNKSLFYIIMISNLRFLANLTSMIFVLRFNITTCKENIKFDLTKQAVKNALSSLDHEQHKLLENYRMYNLHIMYNILSYLIN